MDSLEFALFLWETTKPAIVKTDNKAATRFFQTKQFHQRCETHQTICCTLVSKLQSKPAQSTQQLIWRYFIKPRKTNRQQPFRWQCFPWMWLKRNSSYSTKRTTILSQEEKTVARNKKSRQPAKEGVANQESSSLRTSIKEFTKVDEYTTS